MSDTTIVERVVEVLPKLDPKQSYFVELEGERLLLKRFDRGKGPFTSYLRATGVPFGSYAIVKNTVVHRYDPSTVLGEVTRHQQLLRMQSPAFHEIVKQLAKRVGGRLARLDDAHYGDTYGWVGYKITPKRGARVDLGKLQRSIADQPAVVFALSYVLEDEASELGVLCADTLADAVALWFGDRLRPLLALIDEHCGLVAVDEMSTRSLQVRTARVPKSPAAVIRALENEVSEGEGSMDASRWKQMLASRELRLWWDY